MPTLNRHYVAVDKRLVHYRTGGNGPPVLILHQSPQSSTAVVPLAEKLSRDFTVIAPDTPGFGLSGPLPIAEPSIEDFADALAVFLDSIAAPPLAVTGTHTGAEIALELALRHPDKVQLLLLDGLPLFTQQESADILAHYLPDFTPQWDGSHLTWLWARLREQLIFFPWYKKTSDYRMHFDMPPADYILGWFMDFMYAGSNYRSGYAAAFRYHPDKAISTVRPTTVCLYRPNDVLAQHQQRLPPLPAGARTENTAAGIPAMEARITEILQQDYQLQAAWKPDATAGDNDRNFLVLDHGLLHYITAGNANKSGLLFLHATGRSADSLEQLIVLLSEHFYV
ncbi:MAG: alpha/beta fold hydrolase, partial [Gammaproteobacteria bacterium]